MVDFQFIVEYFKQLPLIIKLIWLLSALLLMLIGGFIIYLKILRSSLRENEKKFKKYRNKYEEELINYLYAGEEENKLSEQQIKIIKSLKRSIRNKFKRDIIISVLSKLIDEISGEIALSIKKLYFETGLVDYSFRKLKLKSGMLLQRVLMSLLNLE